MNIFKHDNSFNKLLELQIQVKKESSTKILCKQLIFIFNKNRY